MEPLKTFVQLALSSFDDICDDVGDGYDEVLIQMATCFRALLGLATSAPGLSAAADVQMLFVDSFVAPLSAAAPWAMTLASACRADRHWKALHKDYMDTSKEHHSLIQTNKIKNHKRLVLK